MNDRKRGCLDGGASEICYDGSIYARRGRRKSAVDVKHPVPFIDSGAELGGIEVAAGVNAETQVLGLGIRLTSFDNGPVVTAGRPFQDTGIYQIGDVYITGRVDPDTGGVRWGCSSARI